MRHSVIMAASLLVSACSSQLAYDLGKAEDECHARTWSSKAALVGCLHAQERPVWAKDEPQTLDLYDGFAAARKELAQQFDRGTLGDSQYRDRLARIADDFRARITERRKAASAPE
ncbi:MAG: hypothetical protein ACREDY_01335 [Bradyrhizobium sp.]